MKKNEILWEQIGRRHHHGICVPLFSLRTKNSCGIGEFLDLIPLIDWCPEVGFDILQLLPLNDTGFGTSPYNPRSALALDPIFLSLHELEISTHLFDELNTNVRLIRGEVLKLKMKLLEDLFKNTYSKLEASDPYKQFINENPWLNSYGAFKALKEHFKYKHWKNWPKKAKPDEKRVQFYIFLQFHCFRQMEKVKKHAESKEVKLKGDIPILLSPDSSDVWANPQYFDLNYSAGVPPDYFNQAGQNWGFPLFNWDVLRKDDFSWWKTRLQIAEKFYHIYRIDHAIGFFRIFGIPRGKSAASGIFFPEDEKLWPKQGLELLEMMTGATNMFPMAEDLGTVPDAVRTVLKELQICGTKIMRWETQNQKYIPLDQYEPISMTTVSNHDTDLLDLWWKKNPAEAAPFAEFMKWTYEPILTREKRLEILRASHHTASLFHINPLQEYLALFPELIHVNPQDERINVPGTQTATNWSYRLRTNLDEITSHIELKKAIEELLR